VSTAHAAPKRKIEGAPGKLLFSALSRAALAQPTDEPSNHERGQQDLWQKADLVIVGVLVRFRSKADMRFRIVQIISPLLIRSRLSVRSGSQLSSIPIYGIPGKRS
jgi:hypothetical protein